MAGSKQIKHFLATGRRPLAPLAKEACMVRTRLSLLTLAIGLTAASGCAFRSWQVTTPQSDCCACNQNPYGAIGAGVAGLEQGLGSGYEGPILMQPDGGFVPPTPTGPPPRIKPVPQAV